MTDLSDWPQTDRKSGKPMSKKKNSMKAGGLHELFQDISLRRSHQEGLLV
jgi:hypothetical protein